MQTLIALSQLQAEHQFRKRLTEANAHYWSLEGKRRAAWTDASADQKKWLSSFGFTPEVKKIIEKKPDNHITTPWKPRGKNKKKKTQEIKGLG